METDRKNLLNINASTCTCIPTHAQTEKSLLDIIQFKNISASWISNTPQLILNLHKEGNHIMISIR